MAKRDYVSRICDKELQDVLSSAGAVLIEGAKWCGKTSTRPKYYYNGFLSNNTERR